MCGFRGLFDFLPYIFHTFDLWRICAVCAGWVMGSWWVGDGPVLRWRAAGGAGSIFLILRRGFALENIFRFPLDKSGIVLYTMTATSGGLRSVGLSGSVIILGFTGSSPPTTRGARYPSALPYSGYLQFTPFAALRMSWSPHSGYGGGVVPGEAAAASVAAVLREPLVVMAQGHPTGRAGNAV